MKKWILIITLLVGTFINNIYSAENTTNAEKEYLQQLKQLSKNDTSRLAILNELAIISKNPEKETYYINQLLKEAKELKSNLYICQAYLSFIYQAYNAYDSESVNRWLKRLEPIARKEKYYDLYFLGRRCAIDMLMINGEYEREEKEAKEMLKDAKELNNSAGIAAAASSISNIYSMTNRKQEALQILEDYYNTALKVRYNLSLEMGNSLIGTYSSLKDQYNTFKWIKKQESNILQLINENPNTKSKYDIWLLMIYVNYLDYYNKAKNIEMAEKYLKLAEKYYTNFTDFTTISTVYHLRRLEFFELSNQTDKALSEVNTLIEVNKKSNPLIYTSTILFKANILRKSGQYNEALSIYDKAFVVKDSLQVAHINTQLNQLKSDYNANQLLLERENIDRKTQMSLLIVIGIVIVLLIYIFIHTYRIRKQLNKAEKTMRKMSEAMETANIAKERFLSTISSSIDIPLKNIVEEALLLSSEAHLPEEQKKLISNNLNTSSAELMELINNILDLSRLEAGMMKFQAEDVDIIALTRNIIRNLNKSTSELSVILPDNDITFILSIDINRISNVISNLLSAPSLSDQISLEVSLTEKKIIYIIKGTALAEKERSQNQIVTNEINRMIIEHFGGTYEIHSESTPPYISFTMQMKIQPSNKLHASDI